MKKIVVLGAGGKMGYRCSANLRNAPYEVMHVEVSEAGRERLKALDIACRPAEEALPQADVVVLAIPDNAIGKATHALEPLFKQGAILIALDAAAPFAGELPDREDLTIFVAHPCHPPIFNEETDLEAKRDYFGGLKARQGIVCAMMRGPDSHFDLAEDVARRMYAPVIREATDEAVRRGVPKEVAHDFILGHLNVELAILFDQLPGVRMSDAANRAVERAKLEIFQADWKKVFEPDAIRESIRMITHVQD